VSASDAQLVLRCLGGDEAACRSLYAAHAGRVTAFFLRSGFGRADADDLAQEVFVRAFKSLGTFDAARGTLGPWLGAIARNVARRVWQRRSQPQSFDPALADAMFTSAGNPGDESALREQCRAVTQCVGWLPPGLAYMVRLRYVEGRTTRGIAEATGIPESTVRLRLKEALTLLQQCLQGKGIIGE